MREDWVLPLRSTPLRYQRIAANVDVWRAGRRKRRMRYQLKTLDMHGLHSSKESGKWTGIGRFD
jgi:hypothetical protein